jgi:hypothetical protein
MAGDNWSRRKDDQFRLPQRRGETETSAVRAWQWRPASGIFQLALGTRLIVIVAGGHFIARQAARSQRIDCGGRPGGRPRRAEAWPLPLANACRCAADAEVAGTCNCSTQLLAQLGLSRGCQQLQRDQQSQQQEQQSAHQILGEEKNKHGGPGVEVQELLDLARQAFVSMNGPHYTQIRPQLRADGSPRKPSRQASYPQKL